MSPKATKKSTKKPKVSNKMAVETTPPTPAPAAPPNAGFSLIELMIVCAIILIISAVAIPNFLSAKNSATQSAGVSTLDSITKGSQLYSTQFGNGFAHTLAIMGGTGTATCDNARILANDLTSAGISGGYTYTYTPVGAQLGTPATGCTTAGHPTGFVVLATPSNANLKKYCSTQSMSIHIVTGTNPADDAACEAFPVISAN